MTVNSCKYPASDVILVYDESTGQLTVKRGLPLAKTSCYVLKSYNDVTIL
jgi:hypothetical protein